MIFPTRANKSSIASLQSSKARSGMKTTILSLGLTILFVQFHPKVMQKQHQILNCKKNKSLKSQKYLSRQKELTRRDLLKRRRRNHKNQNQERLDNVVQEVHTSQRKSGTQLLANTLIESFIAKACVSHAISIRADPKTPKVRRSLHAHILIAPIMLRACAPHATTTFSVTNSEMREENVRN